jgi:hypothetical protein
MATAPVMNRPRHQMKGLAVGSQLHLLHAETNAANTVPAESRKPCFQRSRRTHAHAAIRAPDRLANLAQHDALSCR